MKNSLFLFLLIFCDQISFSQTLDFDKISFEGISIVSSKEAIIAKLGNPENIYEPSYECGFLSAESQMKVFYSLNYPGIRFTGNDIDSYILDEIVFNDKSLVLNYAGHLLNSETDIYILAKIFSEEGFKDLPSNNGLVGLGNKNRAKEDGFMFEIKNGKLFSIRYWSPC